MLADGFTIPWDVARDPSGVVVTGERGSGALYAIRPGGDKSAIQADLGPVFNEAESGLMGIALAADFETSRELYTCHSSADHNDNRVTAWTATSDWSAIESPRVVVDGIPLSEGGFHSGCRILPMADGSLYIGTGDTFSPPLVTISSFSRPVIVTKPSSSMLPWSPVWIQPSASSVLRVSSSCFR